MALTIRTNILKIGSNQFNNQLKILLMNSEFTDRINLSVADYKQLKENQKAFSINSVAMEIGAKRITSNDIVLAHEITKQKAIDKVLSFSEGTFILENHKGARIAKITGISDDGEYAYCQDPASDGPESEYIMSFDSINSICSIDELIIKKHA